jgi:hypothetical protein
MKQMEREIGGYLELERNTGSLLHEGALALNSGRTALAYLIEQRQIRRIALPRYLCDVVRDVCLAHGTQIRWYPVGMDLLPPELPLAEDEWLYVVNYYGQLDEKTLGALAAKTPRLIVDHAQAYFAPPVPGADNLYTCRKFLGVPDGAFLYTDAPRRELERDVSYGRMDFILGRFEAGASAFYRRASENNEVFSSQPPMQMSRLTENLLRGLDYTRIRQVREENFALLSASLDSANLLKLRPVPGPFAYTFLIENGAALRKKLIEHKIYVPTLWPNVTAEAPSGSPERFLAENILPLPCDQRYGAEEMTYLLEVLQACIS